MLPPAHGSAGHEKNCGLRGGALSRLGHQLSRFGHPRESGGASGEAMVRAVPDHTAIPEKFGAPIRERFGASDTMRPPGVQMPVFAPGRKVIPSLAEPKE